MPSPRKHQEPGFVAIDFGTSNSAVALPQAEAGVRLVELEPGFATMPTAVFYRADTPPAAARGRARLRACRGGRLRGGHRRPPDALDEEHPRLVAARRSAPTSAAAARCATATSSRLPASPQAAGRSRGRLRAAATGARPAGVLRRRRPGARRQGPGGARSGGAPGRLRRGPFPVRADRRGTRPRAARSTASSWCWWPTSVAAPPTSRSCAWDRRGVAAPSGATTSWPTMACTWRAPTSTAISSWPASCRCSATAPGARRAPAKPRARCPAAVYFDLATWHLINTVYAPARVAELRSMKRWYADPRHHARLLARARATSGSCAGCARPSRRRSTSPQTGAGRRSIWRRVERGPGRRAGRRRRRGGHRDRPRTHRAGRARDCARRRRGARGGRRALLHRRIDRPAAAGGAHRGLLPGGGAVRGDRFASVAQGLGLHARAAFGPGA